ncbi:MAG: DNA primase, partial [Dolichospermum sp.]
ENLLTQIKPNSLKSLSPRINKPQPQKLKLSLVNTERTLLERAEASLLIIYIHFSEQRQIIIDELETRNLEFSLSHHRFLWQQMLEFPLDEFDLISSMQNRYLELGEGLDIISHLFHLNEKNKKEDILRISYIIQVALACMERV